MTVRNPKTINGTPKALALGNALRTAREDAGFGMRQLAAGLGQDQAQLSRWENGIAVPKPTDVARVLTYLGVNVQRYNEILDIASGPHEPHWLATTLPEQRQQLVALVEYERQASAITEASPLLIPGLLQTADYARALMTGAKIPPDEIESRVAIRMGRRDALTGHGPVSFAAFIGEAALRQRMGSAEIMAGQLEFLLELAALPNVELWVVPNDLDWHPALDGPFYLVESAHGSFVSLENRRSALFLHEREDVLMYREAANGLREIALPPPASAGFIQHVLDQWRAS